MEIPIKKNRSWMARVHQGIDHLDLDVKCAIMKLAGQACASDILLLCEKNLGKKVRTVEDLITGWNNIRERMDLHGRWEKEGNALRGVFSECGCPLIRSGLVELHPVQCYCSQGMMETIFSQVSGKRIEVEIKRSIGRGDDVCDFLIKL